MNGNIIFVVGLWLGVMLTLGTQWIMEVVQKGRKTK